jgi:hypothetical protein
MFINNEHALIYIVIASNIVDGCDSVDSYEVLSSSPGLDIGGSNDVKTRCCESSEIVKLLEKK